MGITKFLAILAVGALSLPLFNPAVAHADYDQRLSLGVGFVTMNNPSQTSFELGAEYENRIDPMLGLGVSANYIFSSPGITLIAVPDVFFHPFASEFFLSAAPLLEFGSATGTNVGARIGTRVPVPLGAITLYPSFSIDFINGSEDYIFGIGISF
jgi:hypothetical protein